MRSFSLYRLPTKSTRVVERLAERGATVAVADLNDEAAANAHHCPVSAPCRQ